MQTVLVTERFYSLNGIPEWETNKDVVKQWYDGFIFGGFHRVIYNPWSITNYLKEKKLRPYYGPGDTRFERSGGKAGSAPASPGKSKEYMERSTERIAGSR